MVLELSDKQQPNIKDLTIEAPGEGGIPFDPAEMISEEEIDHYKDYLKKDPAGAFWEEPFPVHEYQAWDHYFKTASGLKLLFPDRFSPSDLSENALPFLDTYLKKHPLEKDTTMTRFALAQKIFSPDHFQDDDKNKQVWEEIKERIPSLKDEWSLLYLKLMAEYHLLFPKEFETFTPDDEVLEEMRFWTKDLNDKKYPSTTGKDYDENYTYSTLLSWLKLVYPDKLKQMGVDWKRVREDLNRYRDSGDFVELASWVKILAAKEIKFDKGGINLVMPQADLVKPNPSLPEVKKF